MGQKLVPMNLQYWHTNSLVAVYLLDESQLLVLVGLAVLQVGSLQGPAHFQLLHLFRRELRVGFLKFQA